MPKHQSPKPFRSGRGFCDEQLSRQKSCVRDEVWSVAASARRRSITEIIFDRLNSRNHHFIITIQIRRHLGEISPSNAAKQHWLLQWKHRCYAIDTAQCARALLNSAKPHLWTVIYLICGLRKTIVLHYIYNTKDVSNTSDLPHKCSIFRKLL